MPVDISTFVNVSLLQGQHPYRGPGRVGPARNLFSEGLPAGLVPILSAENTVRYTLLKIQFIGTLSFTLPEFLQDCSAPLSVRNSSSALSEVLQYLKHCTIRIYTALVLQNCTLVIILQNSTVALHCQMLYSIPCTNPMV